MKEFYAEVHYSSQLPIVGTANLRARGQLARLRLTNLGQIIFQRVEARPYYRAACPLQPLQKPNGVFREISQLQWPQSLPRNTISHPRFPSNLMVRRHGNVADIGPCCTLHRCTHAERFITYPTVELSPITVVLAFLLPLPLPQKII